MTAPTPDLAAIKARAEELMSDSSYWTTDLAAHDYVPRILALIAHIEQQAAEIERLRGEREAVVLARNSAYRQRDEERAAKEGNIRALNAAIIRAEAAEAREAALVAKVEALADAARYREAPR